MCRGKTVFFSNAMGEELFKTWSHIAEKAGYSELAELLRVRSNFGLGCCATGMDREYLGDEFHQADILAQWIDTMQALILDIKAGGKASRKMDVKWSEEIRASLLERLQDLLDALRDDR